MYEINIRSLRNEDLISGSYEPVFNPILLELLSHD